METSNSAVGATATIVILSAPTGGGHESTARGLAEALQAAAPGVRVCIYNLPADGPGATGRPPAPETQAGARKPWCAIRRAMRRPYGVQWMDEWPGIDRCYDAVTAYAPPLWGAFYHLTNREWVVRAGVSAALPVWGRWLRSVLRAERPDLVVSVHPLCARLAAHALATLSSTTPHHCVVTDLATIHRCWAAPGVAAFYVASADAAAALAGTGVSPARIVRTGLPLRRAFAAPPVAPPRGTAPVVLLLGGKRSARAFTMAVRMLLATDRPMRLVIACGDDDRARRRLSTLARGRATVTVLGWQGSVAELMRGADVVVTKAGSATLAEAFSQARPVLTYLALPGQEDGNVALLQREGLGAHVDKPGLLPDAVARLNTAAPAGCDNERAAWWGGAAARVAGRLLAALPEPARGATPTPDTGDETPGRPV